MNSNTKQTYLNKIMTIITFAEAGEYEMAKSMSDQANKKRKRLETRLEQRPTLEF
jgi:hypothetical protein